MHNSVKLRHARSYGVETTAIVSSNFAVTICFPKLTVPEQINIGKVIFPEVIRRKTHRYRLLRLEIGICPKFFITLACFPEEFYNKVVPNFHVSQRLLQVKLTCTFSRTRSANSEL